MLSAKPLILSLVAFTAIFVQLIFVYQVGGSAEPRKIKFTHATQQFKLLSPPVELVGVLRDSYGITAPPPPPPPPIPVMKIKLSKAALSSQALEAQAYAQTLVPDPNEFTCLVQLWNKESGWRFDAANPSGAYGIPQALPGNKMSKMGDDWETNYKTQINWGIWYIEHASYKTPCNAWQHSVDTGWY